MSGRPPLLWRVALRLLPPDFRERHGAELRAAAEVHLLHRGMAGRAGVWVRSCADVVACAAGLRARAGWRIIRRAGATTMRGAMRDLAFAARALRRRPGYTTVAVLTLAVGIGATTAIYSVVHGVLLRPLPYPDGDRIGILWHEFGEGAQNLPAVHPLDVYDYRDRSRLFEAATLASGREWILGGADDPELVDVGIVEAGFFEFFGADALHGRTFGAEDDHSGAAHSVVLSHRLWQRRFGGDPAVVGQAIEVAGTTMQVLGVLPAWFRLELPPEAFLLRDAELWIPARIDPERLPPRNFTGFTGFVRLRPGTTFAAAQGEIEALAGGLREEHAVHEQSGLRARVEPLHHDVVKASRRTILLLFGAVGFVLLIACANVANLALVRGQARSAELTLRTALGAPRPGLARLVLAECGLLAGAGALLGLALSAAILELLVRHAAGSVPRLDAVALDPAVLAFAAVVTALSVTLFGLVPALRAARQDPGEILGGAARGGGVRGARRLADLLVVGEIAASLVLLVGTGLVVRSFVLLGSAELGWETEGGLTFRLNLPGSEGEARAATFDELHRALAGLPGVESVSSVSQLPLTGSGSLQPYAYDEASAAAWESVTADGRFATPDFFETMGARFVAGRPFTAAEVEDGGSIVIDERVAAIAFPGEEAVGRLLQVNPDDAPEEVRYARVVGVVEHLKLHDPARAHLAQIWFPMQRGTPRFSTVVRTSGDPEALVPAVRAEVARLAPGAPIEDVRTLDELVGAALAPVRLAVALMGAFGLVALMLASVGIYGLLAYAVGQRSREIGVRMALGQAPAEIRRMVLGQGLRLVVPALAIGLVGAAALSGAAAGLLYEVEPLDPWTYVVMSVVLAASALAACWLPARRATHVDPATSLRA